jgi:hypothetical protein
VAALTSVRLVLDWLSYLVTVASVVGWTWAMARRRGRRRIARRFFGADNVKIYFPIRRHAENRMVIANEDFLAASELSGFLRACGLKTSFQEIKPAGNYEFAVGSVAICGPKSSEAVKRLYDDDPNFVLEEHKSAWEIRERSTGNYLRSPMDRQPPEPMDLAYIGRRQNTQRQHFLLIGGIHAAGSLGAIKYLANIENIEKLIDQVGDRGFSMVVKTGFNTEQLNTMQAEVLLPAQKH